MAQLVLDYESARRRIRRIQEMMIREEIHALLLPVSGELKWLVGYDAHALERLTCLVVKRAGTPVLVAPELEVNMLEVPSSLFTIKKWSQEQNPFQIVSELLDDSYCKTLVVGKDMAVKHFLPILRLLSVLDVKWLVSGTDSNLLTGLRRYKDAAEIAALRKAAESVDYVIEMIQNGRIPLVGRTEEEVAATIAAKMTEQCHDSIGFTIVATGRNAADPHYDCTKTGKQTRIQEGQIVLFDIGGPVNGYCSDITRCVHIGNPPPDVAHAYSVLVEAQEAAFRAVRPGVPACDIHAAAMGVIAQAGFGEMFIHSTGHGIGLDPHEDPFITAVNKSPVQVGDTFSIEPGIYNPTANWGMRLEDIVVVTPDGAERLNSVSRDLIVINS